MRPERPKSTLLVRFHHLFLLQTDRMGYFGRSDQRSILGAEGRENTTLTDHSIATREYNMHYSMTVRTSTAALAMTSTLELLWPSTSAAQATHLSARTSVPTSIAISLPVVGTRPWSDTGIDVTRGTRVRITASGIITFSPGVSDGPAGNYSIPSDPTYIAPNLPRLSLIARVGSELPFEIGEQKVFVVKTSGRLALGDNDSYFGDNSGNWTATVKIYP